MRRRSTEIIQYLIKNSDRNMTLKELTSKYEISQKVLKSDMKEINQFLRTIPAQEIEISDNGQIILGEDFKSFQIQQYLYEMDTYMYKFSPDERQIYIMMKLVIANSYITMQSLAEELSVSRITIVNDMEVIKEKFKNKDNTLTLDSGKGMLLKCNEKEKIELLIELYRAIAVNVQNDGFFQRMILNQVTIKYRFSQIFEYMQEFMQVSNMVFVEDVFYDIVLYLFVVFNFAKKEGRNVERQQKLSGIDHMILYAGHMLDVTVTQEMVEDFQQYISDHELRSFVKTVDEIELYKVIMRFIRAVDEETQLNLVNDGKLMDSLLMHIRSMKDWGNYEVEFPENTSIDYEWLEKIVDKNVYILEKFLTYKLSENMKKSIVIHICVAIIRNRKNMAKISVVIVCPGSMATGKYLEAQIKNYFDFHIIGGVAAHEVLQKLEKSKEQVDFIISTVSIHTDKYKVIKVHPFLQMEDMNLIQKETFQNQRMKPTTFQQKQELLIQNIHTIFQNTELADMLENEVKDTIKRYKEKIQEDLKTDWHAIFEPEMIEIIQKEIPWKEAMYYVSEPLQKKKYISSQYIEQAIRNVEEFGDYIVVSKGVALAHASKDSGVFKDGMSLLISKEGIEIADAPGKVHLLFCFASTGEKEYYQQLKTIMMLGRIQGKVEEILKLDNKEEIYHLITGI